MKCVLLVLFLIVSGCAFAGKPIPDRVLIVNYSDKVLDINIAFKHQEYGESTWSTTIASDHLDHWEYTRDRDYKEILDKRLQTMTIMSVDGCSKVFTREQIENIAVYSEGWQITLDNSVISCKKRIAFSVNNRLI